MTFLQPYLLLALPLIALPILIHLINQNRHRTVQWAATMFLLQAKRMARGMARLRYILIMLARMLAVAGLIFALSRPMAGGWLGLTSGGSPELTIVVLDRSVSMEDIDAQTGRSKRATALARVAGMLRDTGSRSKIAVFDSATGQRIDLEATADLESLPETAATSTTTDLPALLQDAAEFIETSAAGRTDIWVCSDLRQSDWSPASGRWQTIRQQLEQRTGVRVYLLAYADVPPDNLAISVSGVHRRETSEGAELVMDLKVTRSAATEAPVNVPITLELNGARSALDIELTGSQMIRNGHAIPIDRELKSGWGRLELPRDANLTDNSWSFVFAEPVPQRTVVVSDEPALAELFRLAAATPSDRSLSYEAVVLTTDQTSLIEWDKTALIIWQAALPAVTASTTGTSVPDAADVAPSPGSDEILARQLESFVAAGGCVMVWPTESPSSSTLFGCRWGEWKQPEVGDHFPIARWRTDADLLSNTQSGTPLPVAQVLTYQACELLADQMTVLAQLEQGPPLLARVPTDQGGVWFCSTLPQTESSNLVSNGIAFYVMIQRAIARGAAALGNARQYDCGRISVTEADRWTPLEASSQAVLLSQRSLNAGIYQSESATLALNRPLVEDAIEVISDETLEQLLSGLNYTRIDDTAGSTNSLASEVWRTFLIAMIVALMLEAVLCIPERVAAKSVNMPAAEKVRTQRA